MLLAVVVGLSTLVAPPLAGEAAVQPAECPPSIAGQALERQEVDGQDNLPSSAGLACFYEDAFVAVLYFVSGEGTTGSCTGATDRLGADFILYDPAGRRRVVASGIVHEGSPGPFIDVGRDLLEAYAPLAAECPTPPTTAASSTTAVSPTTDLRAPTTLTEAAGQPASSDDAPTEEALFLATGIIMIALGIFPPPFMRRFFGALARAFGLTSEGELEARYGPPPP